MGSLLYDDSTAASSWLQNDDEISILDRAKAVGNDQRRGAHGLYKAVQRFL